MFELIFGDFGLLHFEGLFATNTSSCSELVRDAALCEVGGPGGPGQLWSSRNLCRLVAESV